MKKKNAETSIETFFRDQVQKNAGVRNAYLLVHSDKLGVHINLAEGLTGGMPATPQQPYYTASVGKIFTSTLIGLLHDEGKLSFEDTITAYLDQELLDNLHVYKGSDHTGEITIGHLLNHTSGLGDNFWPLLDQVLETSDFSISPRQAVAWTKNHSTPQFPPGEGFHYADTNYHLLGLIVEHVTGMPFHEALKLRIFQALGMQHASMLHYSEPMEECPPTADFYFRDIKMNDLKGYGSVDYAGGGVVATSDNLLRFMKALVSHELVSEETLKEMTREQARYGFGIGYGYGIMKFKTIPIIMPKKLNVWGHAGATGAFMFYHPEMDVYLIGTFNQLTYERKGVQFMLKVVNRLF